MRKYTEEEKRQAIINWLMGQKADDAASSIGTSSTMIYKWAKSHGINRDDSKQIRRMAIENQKLKEELVEKITKENELLKELCQR